MVFLLALVRRVAGDVASDYDFQAAPQEDRAIHLAAGHVRLVGAAGILQLDSAVGARQAKMPA
jgi:hypothetical protein